MPVSAAPMTTESANTAFVSAVSAVFHAQYDGLYRYLDRLTDDPDLAMDIAQETFVRLYQRGSMPDDPRGWIVSVAMNLLRTDRRQERRRGEIMARHGPTSLVQSSGEASDAGVLAGEARDQVKAALDALPLRDRQILLLRHEGYSYRELAGVLGVAESSVGTTLMRAMRAFEAVLRKPVAVLPLSHPGRGV